MIVIGFTGTRTLRREFFAPVAAYLDKLVTEPCEFVTGAALGIDTFVASWAANNRLARVPVNRILVPGASHNSRFVNAMAYEPGVIIEHVGSPLGERDAYRYRNGRIVDAAHKLVAFPLRAEARDKRSGTWMTVRIARKLDVPVQGMILETGEELEAL